jgi:hypothetical protein
MSNCHACTAWEADHISGKLITGCDDCTARDIARGYDYWNATVMCEKEPLQAVIARSFPDDLDRGKRLVWDWAKKVGARK